MRVYSIGEHEKGRIKRLIKEFLMGREEVLFAYLHGSFLSGPFRDIDIAVYTDGERDVFYELELEERLGFPVDVRVLNNAPISFIFKVPKGELLFSRDEEKRCDFESRTMGDYHDFQYYLNAYRREIPGV
ncbi:nucleotidyltransferase domain-containing protein [Thermococcus atlanticus]